MSVRAVDEERALRFALWGTLQGKDGAAAVEPSVLHKLGVYRPQRGIWVDKERTKVITADGVGVTVAILHTGTAYDDDVSDECIEYRYPQTGMEGRDAAEIAATKNAMRLGIPVFVVAASLTAAKLRRVRLGWVANWDDRAGHFLVIFGEEPPAVSTSPDEDAPFSVQEAQPRRLGLTSRRSGQTRFHFRVILRYGLACALCKIDVREVLDTPHLVPVKSHGTNDPRNGLVMCATHHRAFDAHLFGIEPETLRVRFASSGPDARRLGIHTRDLTGLAKLPHPEALDWRFRDWLERARA